MIKKLNMTKKILILFLIIISQTSITNATGDCLILNTTSPVITKYLENNRKVIRNITNEITSSNEKPDLNLKNKSLAMINNLISLEWYISYFEYYVSFPISNDISNEVKRDYRLLESEWEWLNSYLKTISNKWYNNPIKNACNWVTNCELSWSSFEIVWKLIQNQSKIINLYRQAVMWDLKDTTKIEWLILVDNKDNKFITELINNYWYWNNCTASEWSFFAKIWKKIKSIWDYENNYKNWVNEWKEAIALLYWKWNNSKKNEYEEDLLKKELSRQWIYWDKAEIILKNLQDFNSNWWYNSNNNFISNTYDNFKSQIIKEKEKFNTNVIDEFKNLAKQTDTKPITSILNEQEKVKVNKFIAESVSKVYNSELPFIEISNQNSLLIRTDIINMHNNLNNSINKLNELYKISEKVCNDQDTWNWICTTN